MNPGYWQANYFPLNYWQEDYWADYGLVVPPVQIYCNLRRLWILTGRI